MTDEEEAQKAADEIVKSIKPMIEEFLAILEANNLELDDNGDIVPKKPKSPVLNRKKRGSK